MRWQEHENEEAFEESLERFLKDITSRYGSEILPARIRAMQKGAAPLVSLEDTGHTFVLRAELPGVAATELKVATSARAVTIEGRWPATEEAGNNDFLLLETNKGHFRRVVQLPEPVAGDLAAAILENGVLEIELPKSSASAAGSHEIVLS